LLHYPHQDIERKKDSTFLQGGGGVGGGGGVQIVEDVFYCRRGEKKKGSSISLLREGSVGKGSREGCLSLLFLKGKKEGGEKRN